MITNSDILRPAAHPQLPTEARQREKRRIQQRRAQVTRDHVNEANKRRAAKKREERPKEAKPRAPHEPLEPTMSTAESLVLLRAYYAGAPIRVAGDVAVGFALKC